MATITTGKTDTLRTYYELRMGTYDVFQAVFQILESHWYEDAIVRDLPIEGGGLGEELRIQYESGVEFIVTKSRGFSVDPRVWDISSIEAVVNSNGDSITLTGDLSLDLDYKLAVGSVASKVVINDPMGGIQLLNSEAMPSSATLIGETTVETNGNPFLRTVYTEKSASWDDGLKLRLLGETFDSNEAGAPEKTQTLDTVIVEQSGEEIFRLEDFGYVFSALTDEILDAGPDAFIEHFLSGDDDINGTKGNDDIYAGDGNDVVQSGDGDDTVDSGEGDDEINSGDGNDVVQSGDGDDTVDSGDGDDEIVGGSGLGDDYYDGGSGTDVVRYTSATSGIEVNLAEGFARSLQGDAQIGADTLIRIESVIGGNYSDRLIGDDKANWFKGGAGDDEIIGGAGIDKAQYDEAISTVTKNGSFWTVFGDQLTGIERLDFSDTDLALDLEGSAGLTAKTLAAVIGEDGLSNKEYVGIGLELFDAGQSLATVCELALKAVGATTNEDVVNLLYTNLYGEAPTADVAQPFIDALNNGEYSKGILAAAAAELTDDIGVIDLVGLAETGIEYV